MYILLRKICIILIERGTFGSNKKKQKVYPNKIELFAERNI